MVSKFCSVLRILVCASWSRKNIYEMLRKKVNYMAEENGIISDQGMRRGRGVNYRNSWSSQFL